MTTSVEDWSASTNQVSHLQSSELQFAVENLLLFERLEKLMNLGSNTACESAGKRPLQSLRCQLCSAETNRQNNSILSHFCVALSQFRRLDRLVWFVFCIQFGNKVNTVNVRLRAVIWDPRPVQAVDFGQKSIDVSNIFDCSLESEMRTIFSLSQLWLTLRKAKVDLFSALPYLSNPQDRAPFRQYFSKQWQEVFLVSLHNFLSLAFHQIELPAILAYGDHTSNQLSEETIVGFV